MRWPEGYSSDMDLVGSIAIVTGASSLTGIGRATALALAAEGVSVVVTDVGVNDQLRALSDDIRASGVQSEALGVDITERSQIDQCVTGVTTRFGRIDILINNAGSTIGALPFLDITSEQWDASYHVNLKGTADFCQAVLPQMVEQGSGAIVNNASTAGLGAEPGFGAYNATKHAVVGLTKTIAAEFGVHGIRCNAVCPGYVATDMHTAATQRLADEQRLSFEEMASKRYAGVALRRAATTEEIAQAIVYLAGPRSSYITGVALPVSGGAPVGL